MKKSKRSKRQQHKKRKVPEVIPTLGTLHISLSACTLLTLCACSTLEAPNQNEQVSFSNPPSVGDWLKPQRDLVACESQDTAQFMSNFGFLHPLCQQLTNIGVREYQVMKRQQIKLPEGLIWLLDVKRLTPDNDEQLYYVPVPWHDWL